MGATGTSSNTWDSADLSTALLKAQNLADLPTPATALANLGTDAAGAARPPDPHVIDGADHTGEGDSVTRDVGVGAGDVAAGDDARLSDARAPTAHASNHESGGGDVPTRLVAQATPDTTQQDLAKAAKVNIAPTLTFTADGVSDYVIKARICLWLANVDTADLFYKIDAGAWVQFGRWSQAAQHQVTRYASVVILAAALSAAAHTITLALECPGQVMKVWGDELPTTIEAWLA